MYEMSRSPAAHLVALGCSDQAIRNQTRPALPMAAGASTQTSCCVLQSALDRNLYPTHPAKIISAGDDQIFQARRFAGAGELKIATSRRRFCGTSAATQSPSELIKVPISAGF
jgi:hypothetical protein